MKKLFIIISLIGTIAQAHDEGHGPKLGDQPKFGGNVAAVIDKTEIKKGAKATMLYKAELTKNNENVVRVYLYDKDMQPMMPKTLKGASGTLQSKDRKTKKWISKEFSFTKKDGFFESKLPSNPRRPFNIDVSIDTEGKTLFMAFDNLN